MFLDPMQQMLFRMLALSFELLPRIRFHPQTKDEPVLDSEVEEIDQPCTIAILSGDVLRFVPPHQRCSGADALAPDHGDCSG